MVCDGLAFNGMLFVCGAPRLKLEHTPSTQHPAPGVALRGAPTAGSDCLYITHKGLATAMQPRASLLPGVLRRPGASQACMLFLVRLRIDEALVDEHQGR
jgi:hypothetical protein